MVTVSMTKTDWLNQTHELAKIFGDRSAKQDVAGSFVFDNYKDLADRHYFSGQIPAELGGEGQSYETMCDTIRILANACGSTALAFSMHQHLIAAAVWKYKNKGENQPVLHKVSKEQTVLVSTGARDWLDSNGSMKRVKGGCQLNAKKHFASQSIAGNIAVTSAPYTNEKGENRVFHFAVPLNTAGVSILDDWDVLGMRATGSHTISFENVFIPEESIALDRPAGEFHPVWHLVIGVAMPLIMSAYMGLAERAVELGIQAIKKNRQRKSYHAVMAGKLNNQLVAARAQWMRMKQIPEQLEFTPNEELTQEMLSLKTNVVEACGNTASLAMEAIGGQSFYKRHELERIFRDLQAGQFHPLPLWEQQETTGSWLLAED